MAKGSQAVWSPGDDRTCMICGQKIALTHGAWIHYNNLTKEHRSAHLHCGPPLTERTTMTEVDETSPSETQPEPEPYPENPDPVPVEPPDPDPDEDEPDEEEDVA